MKYITHRRFKGQAIGGQVNIPAMTECELIDDKIMYNGIIICFIRSENSHQFFARNDDSQGLLRGKFTQAIQKHLSVRDSDYQKRWDKIWDDENCQKYKRPEHADYWLWNHEFFGAPISDLKYIANLIGMKEPE